MRRHVNLVLVVLTASIIAYFSIYPVPISSYDTGILTVTQVYHGAAYFSLAAALLLYFHDTTRGHYEAILTATLFGAAIEGVQLFIPGRIFSFIDIAVNLAGASLILLDHRIRFVTAIITVEDRILARLFQQNTAHA